MARQPADPNSQTSMMLAQRTASMMTIEARAYRDAWVREYIKHFNAAKACFALDDTGELSEQAARQKGAQFLREPYVIQRVDEITRAIRPEDVVTRGQVMSAMWAEANNETNDGSTRVAALSHLAKMLGMTTKEDAKPVVHVGVMMVPVMDANTWQQAALQEQAKLKAEVKQVIDGAITTVPMAAMVQPAP